MICHNTLKINKNTAEHSLPVNDLFRKFCPSRQGMIIADLANAVLEIHESGYGKPIDSCKRNDRIRKISQDIVDPNHKLQNLFNEQKIECIKANAPIDQTDIILLDDTFHGNKDQTLVRGQIANALKGDANIFLCEGLDNEKILFNVDQIHRLLPENIEFNPAKDLCAGWDDGWTHKQSLEKVRLSLQAAAIAQKNSESDIFGSITTLMNARDDLEKVTTEESRTRTESEWKTIVKFKDTYPDLKVMVFAGEAHNNEKWLLDKLKNSKYKYCIITPKKCQDNRDQNMIDYGMKYYHVDPANPWANSH